MSFWLTPHEPHNTRRASERCPQRPHLGAIRFFGGAFAVARARHELGWRPPGILACAPPRFRAVTEAESAVRAWWDHIPCINGIRRSLKSVFGKAPHGILPDTFAGRNTRCFPNREFDCCCIIRLRVERLEHSLVPAAFLEAVNRLSEDDRRVLAARFAHSGTQSIACQDSRSVRAHCPGKARQGYEPAPGGVRADYAACGSACGTNCQWHRQA
jgi:hypothetical protein